MTRVRLFVLAALAVTLVGTGVAAATHVFDDVEDNKFYAEPVEWAYDNNITTGQTSSTFGPDDSVTRGESVTFLKRYHDAFVDPAVQKVDQLEQQIDTVESQVSDLQDEIPDVMWAAVSTSGDVTRSSGGVTAELHGVIFDIFFVDFGRDISACAYQATPAYARPVEPTTTLFLPPRVINVMQRPGDPDSLAVRTTDPAGSGGVRFDFHIQVNC